MLHQLQLAKITLCSPLMARRLLLTHLLTALTQVLEVPLTTLVMPSFSSWKIRQRFQTTRLAITVVVLLLFKRQTQSAYHQLRTRIQQ